MTNTNQLVNLINDAFTNNDFNNLQTVFQKLVYQPQSVDVTRQKYLREQAVVNHDSLDIFIHQIVGGFAMGDATKHTYHIFVEAPMTFDDAKQMLLDAIKHRDFVDRTDVILPIVYDDVL